MNYFIVIFNKGQRDSADSGVQCSISFVTGLIHRVITLWFNHSIDIR